jgi:hypothetical protein
VRSSSQVPRLQMCTVYAFCFYAMRTTFPTHISVLDCTTLITAYLEQSMNYEGLHPAVFFMFLLPLSAARSQGDRPRVTRVKQRATL